MTFFDIFSKKEIKAKVKNKIIVDIHEKNSLVPSHLSKNLQIDFQDLKVGDYLINEIIIERKTASDLKSSILSKRIFYQLEELKQYPSYLLIIEGNREEIFNNKFISENAIRGFILSTLNKYKIPIIYTENEFDTSVYLTLLANKSSSIASINPKKIFLSKEKQKRYILESFPGIGPKKASLLIEKFKSLKNIFNASEEELRPILKEKTSYFIDLLNN